MLYGSMDPNERFRSRRARIRRRKRRRRAVALAFALVAVLAVGAGAQFVGGDPAKPKRSASRIETTIVSLPSVPAPTGKPRPLPIEVRGVHVTGALASLPGNLREYVGYKKHGLNTIELDLKDEGGEIGFTAASVPLASKVGAARTYFDPRRVAKLAHANGIYLIGRVVAFQDPLLSTARPDLAIQRRDGSVWKTHAGLGWVNPYDRRVWDYVVSVAEVAAKAGFDEIMLDYLRFPSDGDVDAAVYPGKTSVPRGRVIADFVSYAERRLRPLGVRVSTALFGLSATRDMGLGQVPRWISEHVDTVSPMAYPSLYGNGELGIADPYLEPGETVFRTLADFRRQLKGRKAHLIPWIQDFSGYGLVQVRSQIDAARLQGAKGFLLWNAEGRYTVRALAPG
jgi:hypothetical protein